MISVIICTYNPKVSYLTRTVCSILAQKYIGNFEFIVVDNNSLTPVSELDVIKENKIKVVVEKKPGLTAARECGSLHASGDIVVFIDDDNILEENYLERVEKVFDNPAVGVISGTIIPEYEVQPGKWFKRFDKMLAIRSFRESGIILTSVPRYNEYFPIGAGIGIRHEVLLPYFQSLSDSNRIEGRMGEKLSSGEDIDIDFFAINAGYLIGVFPGLSLTHIIPANRCSINYLRKLAVASLNSSFQINKKWKEIFKQNVFDYFDMHISSIFMHYLLRLMLFPFKRYRIGFEHYRLLLKFKFN